ncbi:MAG: ISKra4 family transposase, partial [Terriglobia bacterium]
MRIRIQVVIESDDGRVEDTQEVACLQRESLKPEEAGLKLEEGKTVLHGIQEAMVRQQVAAFLNEQRCCPHCGKNRPLNGKNSVVYRTLFGKLKLESTRFYPCHCEEGARRSFSPLAELLKERTAPELLYLETKWASLLPFGVTIDLLDEVLPIGHEISTSVISRNLHHVGQRAEAELGEERYMFLDESRKAAETGAEPTGYMTVGLDGGYVHACGQASRQEGWFEVIVGKSITAQEESKCFAFVHKYDQKPKRRVFEVLRSQGAHAGQPVAFLSDGGETVRNLQLYLNPLGEHVLDWFHVTMRLTVMRQMARGMEEGSGLGSQLEKEINSIKWHLWNGNVGPALRAIDGLQILVENDQMSEERKKLLKAVREFGMYIVSNQQFIPHYGDRRRNRERNSTGFVESAINQVVRSCEKI